MKPHIFIFLTPSCYFLNRRLKHLPQHRSALQLSWLVISISPRRPKFDPTPVHVGFVVDNVPPGPVSLRALCLPLMGQASVVRTATRNGLNGPAIKSRYGRDEIFRTRPDRLWGPPSLLYNGYRVSFQGVKRQRPPPSCSEIEK